MSVDPMLDDAVRDVRPALSLVLGAVSFLVLIACVNLANLFGVRASRTRLIGQAVAEAAPLLVLGGVLGIVLAEWAVRAFVTAAPDIPRLDSVALNAPVVAFSLALLVLTGVAASMAPAVQAWASDFTTIAKDGGRSATAGRQRATARRLGVAAQMAFALPLLVGATVLIRSALNVMRVELGFRPEDVATVSFDVSRRKYVSSDEVASYYARVIEAVRAVPGVASAALVNKIPLFDEQTSTVHFENATGTTEEVIDVSSRTVTPDYFATLGIRLLAGRDFTEQDDADAPPVGIVDERVARTIWPGESALGKHFRGGRDDSPATVIGVVAHVRTVGVDVDPRPQVYWSYLQWTQNRTVLACGASWSRRRCSRR